MANAPTWTQAASKTDGDLEAAIAAVEAELPGLSTRDGAILMGFSKGAYQAVKIAAAHPGRWARLVLIEANVQLSVESLRRAGVQAVALIAGQRSGQLRGQKRTADRLMDQGFPAKLWVMPNAGHHYSADIDTIMAEALDFVAASGQQER
jgi:predicted esterase